MRGIESVLAQQLRFHCTAALVHLLGGPDSGARLELVLDFADEGLEIGVGLVGLGAKAVADAQPGDAFCTERRGEAVVLVELREREREEEKVMVRNCFYGDYN